MPNQLPPEFLAETNQVWQGIYGRQLTDEDSRELISNFTAVFDILAEWDRVSSSKNSALHETRDGVSHHD